MANPTKWNPVGHQAYHEIDCLYSLETFESILTIEGVFQPKLKEYVLNAAGWLNIDLHYESRPTVPQRRSAIEPVLKQARALQSTINELDHDSLNLLREASDPTANDLLAPLPRFLDALTGFIELLDNAHGKIGKGQAGRKPHDATRAAVGRLHEGWRITGMREPTLAFNQKTKITSGAFLDFVRAALQPVLEKHGIESKLEHHVREILYE